MRRCLYTPVSCCHYKHGPSVVLRRKWKKSPGDPLLTIAPSLEIGAGGGLVGLAVALGCEVDAPIYITDQENMMALMTENVVLNKLESRVVPLVLDWSVPSTSPFPHSQDLLLRLLLLLLLLLLLFFQSPKPTPTNTQPNQTGATPFPLPFSTPHQHTSSQPTACTSSQPSPS